MYILYGRQSISEADIEAVVRVLRSDFLTQGPAIPAFERAIADYAGAQRGVAVQNGTCALHIACLALGVGPGDGVWTSPNTFVASANCARYCGAEIDFVDIDPRTLNISTRLLGEKLKAAETAGRLPKVVIPVHFGGQSCDMAEIHGLAEQYGVRIIEDASHAIGATYGNTRVGGCAFSDIAIFSFHPVKIITSAEGGMALTNNRDLAERMADLRTHGITRDIERLSKPDEGPWYYEQHVLGFNYRMTELQAALGMSQLSRLDEWIAMRNRLAGRYKEALKGLPLTLPEVSDDRMSAFHLYVVRLNDDAPISRRGFFDGMRAKGIGVNVHYIPVHLQPDFRKLGFHPGQFPVAEEYYRRAVSLPMHVEINDEQFDFIVNSVKELLQ